MEGTSGRGTAAVGVDQTQRAFAESHVPYSESYAIDSANASSVSTRIAAAYSDSSSASAAGLSSVHPLPPLGGPASSPSSRARTAPSPFPSPTAAAAHPSLRFPVATSSPVLRPLLLLADSRSLVPAGVPAAASEEVIEDVVLPAAKKDWLIAAKQYRAELAALRRARDAQLLQQSLARRKTLQQNAYRVDLEEREKRHEEDCKTGEGGRQPISKEETGVDDTEWTAEEVRLLWQGQTVKRKKRKPRKTDEFDSLSRWNFLQPPLLQELPEDVQKGVERRAWQRDEGAATKYEETEAGATTVARWKEEGRRVRREAAIAAEQEEEEEAEKDLPVFGFRSTYKKRQLLTQVRPVWLREAGPLHEDTGLPQSLIDASAAVAPPTRDELRRLVFYPEEVKRRETEDGVVFETAGELLRRHFWRRWKQYLKQRQQKCEEPSQRRGSGRREERETGSSRDGSSGSEIRKRTDGSIFCAEEDESQAEEEETVDEHSARETYNCSGDAYSNRRRPSSHCRSWRGRKKRAGGRVRAAQEGMEDAAGTCAITLASPPPPQWLLPHKGVEQPTRRSKHSREAATVDAAAPGDAEEEEDESDEEEESKARASEQARSTDEEHSSPSRGRYRSRRRKVASPAGVLDDELVVVREPRRGWTWTIEDRHRWKRSRILRKAMKDNLLLFAADLEERQYAEDFERFMGKRFIPPRADWGGYAYYAAAEDDEEEFPEEEGGGQWEPGRVGEGVSGREDGGAAAVRARAWREAFDAYVQEQERREQEDEQAMEMAKQLVKVKTTRKLWQQGESARQFA